LLRECSHPEVSLRETAPQQLWSRETNARFLDKSFGLLRKVHTPGGWEYLLNLDNIKQTVEAEEYGDISDD